MGVLLFIIIWIDKC